ncbi:MAG: purine-nucleoside phosphorylase [Actinomycetia bacterium]|nr:purine-nucleoside phosphorylase [Actinomycetes bacterium]MCP4958166.1 purine-nucleoside phosphorylase [Actinomycetes bacterium]
MTHPLHLANEAGAVLVDKLGDASVAVVLGSGWAAAADGIGTITAEVPLASIPGTSAPAVEGHSGLVRSVTVGDKSAWLFGGRTHLYEGHGPHEVVHAVRAAVLAGCTRVILTNAAGGLNPALGPGTPVMLRDQLNLTGTSPMMGAHPPSGFPGRFCDLTEVYSQGLRSAARTHDPTLTEGVYAGLLGGAYETPAEIQMLSGFGVTLVGMSTVLEAIAAKHLGANIAGISLITNFAAGMAGELSHHEVLDVAAASTDRILALIDALIRTG